MIKALKFTGETAHMKKLILSALILTALSTPTLTHSIPYKTLFDISMILGSSYSLLFNRPSTIRDHYYKDGSGYSVKHTTPPTFLLTHLGIYAYAFHSLWKTYKNYKENAGKIQVKTAH